MPSTKSAAPRPASTLADATAKTRSLIEDLQSRLTGEGGGSGPERPRHAPRRESAAAKESAPKNLTPKEAGAKNETEEDLERQLQAYFDSVNESARSAPATSTSTLTSVPADIRARVIEGVVERILAEWSHPEQGGAAGAALRREVVERLTDRVLEMLHRIAAEDKQEALAHAAASA